MVQGIGVRCSRSTQRDRQSQRRIADRGAALLEFALIAPLFFLVVFGGIEVGLMFRSHLALEDMTRSGARIASVERTNEDADLEILSFISSRSTPLNGDVTRVVIFSTPTLTDGISEACKTSGSSRSNECNVYMVGAGGVQAIVEDLEAGRAPEQGLTRTERDEWSNLGVYIEYDYSYVTGFFDSLTLTSSTVEVVELNL